jgi:hypothetical protein
VPDRVQCEGVHLTLLRRSLTRFDSAVDDARGFGSLILLCVLLSCLIAPTAAATRDKSFDYLYIESNEGGSSGGHTAIRFGRDVYHFQSEKGLLVLRRDRADEFLYAYALLGNRTVHSTRVAVSQETLARIVDRFRRRHRAQEAQIGVANALRDDRQLLELLRDRQKDSSKRGDDPSLPVLGLGYFDLRHPTDGADSTRSRTLQSLSDVIALAHGPNFLSNRRQGLIDAMQVLGDQDPAAWTVESPTSVYEHPPFARPYSNRWLDLVAGIAALDVLREARPLAVASHHVPSDPSFALAPQEVQAFERYAAVLTGQLVALVDSRRADWGQTLLIGMARLSALAQSIESEHLVFLDTFPEATKLLAAKRIEQRPDIGEMMFEENQRQFDGSRAYFQENADASELAWERVEERSNRYLEILRALRDQIPMRVARGHLVPSRNANYPIPLTFLRTNTRRSADLERVRQRERAYSRELRRLHRYGLFDQNCATALFETINDSFGDSIQLSQEQLGGHVRSRNSLAFIPFISAQQVNSRYTVVANEIIPSYRQLRVEEMKSRESAVRVAFRESNTFTATAYERSSDDSFFVFFTDQTPLLRPLFGVVNLTVALGQSVLGILMAPIDRGANLFRGLRGTFVSLPELAFANIRKGSNDWIPNEHRSLVAKKIDGSDRYSINALDSGPITPDR